MEELECTCGEDIECDCPFYILCEVLFDEEEDAEE